SVPEATPYALPEAANAGEVWRVMAEGAREQIELLHFYGVDKEAGGTALRRFLDSLAAAAERGVRVRAVFDAGFARRYPLLPKAIAALPGAEVRLIDAKAHYGGVQHLKMLRVDGREVFIGSQNLDWRALEQIVELGVRTDAACIVEPAGAVFAVDWALAGGADRGAALAAAPAIRAPARCEARVLGPTEAAARAPTPAQGAGRVALRFGASPDGWLPGGVAWELPTLLQTIASARERLHLSMLSMHRHDRDGSDWPVLEDALTAAAERGVQVRVVLGHWSAAKPERMRPLIAFAARHPNLSVRLLHVPKLHEPPIPFARVLHAKSLAVDGVRAWIGTSNGSKGYFHSSRNAGVFIEGAAVAGPLQRWLDALFTRPEALPPDAPPTTGAPTATH
ncbi:MAG: hypothetical protein RIT45_4020, partial [Pseudomonadota bacterium]